jgi:hypothetical protein
MWANRETWLNAGLITAKTLQRFDTITPTYKEPGLNMALKPLTFACSNGALSMTSTWLSNDGSMH